MKMFMRDWMDKVANTPISNNLDCGCHVSKGGILCLWCVDDVEHYGHLCDDHFYEYGAEVITGIDNGEHNGN